MAHWDRRELNKLIAVSPEEYKKRFPEPFSAMIPEDASSENKLATEAYVNEHGGGGSGSDPEAVKYTEQTLTEEQKAQALANIGGASAESVTAETARATSAEEDIMDAMDGTNVETVTVLPAASASTVGKFYYVGPDGNGEYARYRGIESGGSYSFLPVGTTEMNLSTYATKAEVGELEAKVTDLQDGETVLQQQIDAIHPVVIEGNVTNAPDNEDITATPDNRLKFADRLATLTNKGYKILRADKTFASQVTDINTIYEIRYQFSIADAEVTIPSGCELRFNGGNISGNGKLIGTDTFINSDGKCFGKDVVFAGTWANETIFTRWFAFVSSEDGVTDNSVCFKQLQAVINGTKGCKVEFEPGVYQTQIIGMEPEAEVVVDGVTYPKWAMNTYQVDSRVVLNIFELPYLDINLNGATLKAINITCPRWNMIRLSGIAFSRVHDGTLIGMADNFSYPEYVNYTGNVVSNYEFTSLLYQAGGDCKFENITAKYSNGDGIAVGSGSWYFRTGDVRPSGVVPSNTLVNFPADGYAVIGCEVCYCGRNGITLHSSNEGKLEKCHIHNIGSDGTSGTIGSDGIKAQSPMAGIDVEFEDGQQLVPLMTWNGLYIHDCGGKSYGFASPASSKMKQFSATNCRFIRMGVNNNLTAEGPKEFVNCYFEHNGGEGSLYGNDILYRGCQIVLKSPSLLLGASTFDNCVISDEIEEELASGVYVFSEARYKTVFRNSTLTIKHRYGYLQDKTFYDCVLNFYAKYIISACGIECYGCEFHNDPEDDSMYSFYFANGNSAFKTRGHFWFYNCSFEKLRGASNGVSEYAFSTTQYPVILNNCKISERLSFQNGSQAYDVTIRNCVINYLQILSYQEDTTGVKSAIIDSCVISNYNGSYSRLLPVEISNSKVEIISGGNYKLRMINFTKCEIINSETRSTSYPDQNVNAVDCVLNFVANSNTDGFNLVNCYVKGLVTEATFTGTKKNCTFETPFATSGATASRPTASAVGAGFTYFDTDLGKMIVSNGAAWVNMDGTALS